MSDIGLLMTSVLEVGQKVASNLPQQLLVQHENDFYQKSSAYLLNSNATLQVTPPEFLQFDDTFALPVFSLKKDVRKILSDFLAKVVSKKLSSNLEPDLQSASVFIAQREIIADADTNSMVGTINQRRSNVIPTVEFGNSGITVRVLQKLLASNGYSIEVDGFFGALTEVAVKSFQNRRNLVVDGIVGQNTWNELTK